MSQKTSIQWCDSTVNPTMGCDGCELWNPHAGVEKCYAGILHNRYGGRTKGYSPTFDELTFWPGRTERAAKWKELIGTARADKPWLDGLPRLIFVSDMSDALSAGVPFDFLEAQVVSVVAAPKGQRHQWLWLTKRPNRMAQFSEHLTAKGVRWPENLWAGTSVTSQTSTSRIADLCRVGDANTVRFLSVEPQYGPIQFGAALGGVDWVIQGGESGTNATPFEMEWAADVMAQCRAAGVPYFLKQLGSSVRYKNKPQKFKDRHGGDWSEWPDEFRVRQMPRKGAAARSQGATSPSPSAAPPPSPDTRISLDVVEPEDHDARGPLKA